MKKSLKVLLGGVDACRVSYAAAHRQVRYTIDLLSPAELRLLRHAAILREPDEAPVRDFELVELPD